MQKETFIYFAKIKTKLISSNKFSSLKDFDEVQDRSSVLEAAGDFTSHSKW